MAGTRNTDSLILQSGELMRVTRVARILDVTKKRVYNLIHEGKLEAVKIGPRGTRVTRASLARYMERLVKNARYMRGAVDGDYTE